MCACVCRIKYGQISVAHRRRGREQRAVRGPGRRRLPQASPASCRRTCPLQACNTATHHDKYTRMPHVYAWGIQGRYGGTGGYTPDVGTQTHTHTHTHSHAFIQKKGERETERQTTEPRAQEPRAQSPEAKEPRSPEKTAARLLSTF